MWGIVLITVMLLLIVFWWRWATDTGGSVLGETDYSGTVLQFTRCVKDGGRLILEAPSRHASLSLTKCSSESGDGELELRLLGDNISTEQIEELRRNLEVLRIRFSVRESEDSHDGPEVVFRLFSDCIKDGGRIVNLALSAAGVRQGDRYSHRFEGEFETEADTEYLREMTVCARNLAETKFQRSVFDRILNYLK